MDTLSPYTTVYEAIAFSAGLRLSKNVSDRAKANHVEVRSVSMSSNAADVILSMVLAANCVMSFTECPRNVGTGRFP